MFFWQTNLCLQAVQHGSGKQCSFTFQARHYVYPNVAAYVSVLAGVCSSQASLLLKEKIREQPKIS